MRFWKRHASAIVVIWRGYMTLIIHDSIIACLSEITEERAAMIHRGGRLSQALHSLVALECHLVTHEGNDYSSKYDA